MFFENVVEFLLESDLPHGKKDLQSCIDKIEMEDRVTHGCFCGELAGGQEMHAEGGISPAFFEDAVYLIEQEKKSVLLVEGKLHFSCSEGFCGNDVSVGKLKEEHAAVAVCLD